jgi:hypothetical protein
MHQHGAKCLDGPIRGTPGWWQELGKRTGTTEAEPVKKKRARRRPGSNREEGGPAIRNDLVRRVRAEIAAGTYDTAEKWEAALDRLLDHLVRN